MINVILSYETRRTSGSGLAEARGVRRYDRVLIQCKSAQDTYFRVALDLTCAAFVLAANNSELNHLYSKFIVFTVEQNG